MGRESASYFLTIPPGSADGVVPALREGGAELVGSGHSWIDLRVCDPNRYWIDLRLHRGPELLLEVRIALTNDEWSIRGPLETALTTLPPDAASQQLRDEDGNELGTPAERGWSLRLEEDFGRRRAEFVKRVGGDVTAPISADHVYMWIHQTRTRRFDERDLEWRRDAEISRMERMMEGEPDLPADHPDNVRGDED
ncbi:MAG TPA: hypothetical protein VGV67_04660 [Solirubrobacteraceae bacterium]|nr:hypothetical protein [Solirubrobacteraceae bacterium]